MTSEHPNYEERRKYRRYDVDIGFFAVFRQDNSVLPGLIIDISLGGLAFIYYEGEDWPQETEEGYHLFGYEFNVENAPLITMFDAEVSDENHPVYQLMAKHPMGPRKVRRRGVQFGELTDVQLEALEGLIEEFHGAREKQS
ncbi:PilZ domain-containing protein [Thermodesulfobacteriota bacterium]